MEASQAMASVTNQPLDTLLWALKNGWRVQSPVYLRTQWYTGGGNKIGYYFIVKKGNETDLIVIPESDKVRQLIELQRLRVMAA